MRADDEGGREGGRVGGWERDAGMVLICAAFILVYY